jgi:hypothetical protein
MTARVVLACLLAGCGAPTKQCVDFSLAVDGQCPAPAREITIDGDLSDWDDVPDFTSACVECYCTTCGSGEVVTLRATATTDGKLALLAQTKGLPIQAPAHPLQVAVPSYLFGLSTLTGPQTGVQLFATANASAVEMTDAGELFAGLPVAYAFGGSASPGGITGVELAIALDALPIAGGGIINGQLVERDDASVQPEQTVVPTVATCWDASAAVCQPR